jgi:hypothetical protein
MNATNRYGQILERLFFSHFQEGDREVAFEREDLALFARQLGGALPKNLGDIIYSARYRSGIPDTVQAKAPPGEEWIIQPAGRARYRFVARTVTQIVPQQMLAETKVPDATPGIIARYALSDEQALLAKVRYNRLIDVFTGVTCYSLQSHLRTTVAEIGQVETDELYIGVDRRGAQYVFPVQAKGGNDALSVVHIGQDFASCRSKFPSLICRAIAAQFLSDDLIALFEFEHDGARAVLSSERHYRLVAPAAVTTKDLATYRTRPM